MTNHKMTAVEQVCRYKSTPRAVWSRICFMDTDIFNKISLLCVAYLTVLRRVIHCWGWEKEALSCHYYKTKNNGSTNNTIKNSYHNKLKKVKDQHLHKRKSNHNS